MLTKEQYGELRDCMVRRMQEPSEPGSLLDVAKRLLAEYEAANKPKVACPACGSDMGKCEGVAGSYWWRCNQDGCLLSGPLNDHDGRKVMALGKRKLPIQPPFYVDVNGNARQYTALSYSGAIGDPIDISAWL